MGRRDVSEGEFRVVVDGVLALVGVVELHIFILSVSCVLTIFYSSKLIWVGHLKKFIRIIYY